MAIAVLALASVGPGAASAATSVTNCEDYGGAGGLGEALAKGGSITFACDGTIQVTSWIHITESTTLDGSGRNVTISGGLRTRIFRSTAPAFELIGLTIRDALGVGIQVEGPTSVLRLARSRVLHTRGFQEPDWGAGDGIMSDRATVYIEDSELAYNGEPLIPAVPRGTGLLGKARGAGAAIHFQPSHVIVTGSSFHHNAGDGLQARSADVRDSSFASNGGSGLTWDVGTVSDSSFDSNEGGLHSVFVGEVRNCLFTRNSNAINSFGHLSVERAVIDGSRLGLRSAGGASVRAVEFRNNLKPVHSTGGMTLEDATFEHNGESVFNQNVMYVVRSTFAENFATSLHNQDRLYVYDSTFRSNRSFAETDVSAVATGGALVNQGQATVVRSLFDGNAAEAASLVGLGEADGGAIWNSGDLSVSQSSFVSNRAWGDRARGGAIFSTGALRAINTTFASNRADGRGSVGGAVAQETRGTGAELRHVTMSGNAANSGSSLFAGIEGEMVASGSAFDGTCVGVVVDEGHNIDVSGTCQMGAPGSFQQPSLRLGALGDNGGRTPTMLPLPGSPLVDAADPARCPQLDQRGYGRVGVCDVGATELSTGDGQ